MGAKETSGIPHRTGSRHQKVPVGLRLQLVRLCLEEQYPLDVVARESRLSTWSLRRWIRRYQQQGEAGLSDRPRGSRKEKLPAVVTQKALELKKQDPKRGSRRIAMLLKRLFLLPGSHETVRRRLSEQGAASPRSKSKPERNVTRPRFFERSTPNQLWQTDIFTFRLGGRYAYLIGFIDDYSRFITGLGVYRSQTADNLIELYRRSTAEYNVPKEMLTDNGRQYTNWRGTSRFEAQLHKDKVHHIRSRPHHPMTLGKIERFWKSIFEEFLNRAQFDSFENAAERIRLWVQYYNYRRPHQGIGGLCPAERFFEVQNELKKTLEQGVADNVLEMALRGRPKAPFYMVGRMGAQSVVLRAEKGRLRVVVDEQGQTDAGETEYELTDQEVEHGQSQTAGEDGAEGGKDNGLRGSNGEEADAKFQFAAESGGSTVGVVGAAGPLGSVPGAGDSMGYFEPVAGAGSGRDAAGAGGTGEAGQGTGIEPPAAADAAEEGAERLPASETAGAAQGCATGSEAATGSSASGREAITGSSDEHGGQRAVGAPAGLGNLAGAQRSDNGRSGGAGAGGVAQNVLRVGSAGDGGHGGGTCQPACRAACPYRNRLSAGERDADQPYRGVGTALVDSAAERSDQGDTGDVSLRSAEAADTI